MTKHTDLKLSDIVALKTFCETHDIDVKRGRRMARNGKFPNAFQFAGGKSWMIARDADVPEFPDARTKRTRSDGRQRFVVYMTKSERVTVADVVGVDNVVDVRKLAKQRRADKKLSMATVDAIRERDMENATAFATLINGDTVPCPDDTYTTCADCEHANTCVTRGDDVNE